MVSFDEVLYRYDFNLTSDVRLFCVQLNRSNGSIWWAFYRKRRQKVGGQKVCLSEVANRRSEQGNR